MTSYPINPTPFVSTREQIKYRFLYFLNAYPSIYMPIARARYRRLDDFLVCRDTDLVIEAFGRSGTTFANFAFLSAQTRPVKTVHHTHASAQVITAVRMGVPTLVIVRSPLDAALSHMARHHISARPALVAWIRFHARILPYVDRIVVATFEEMTTNFSATIRRVNEKFGTDFGVWEHTEENAARVFEQIRQRNRKRFGDAPSEARFTAIAIPTAEREALKAKMRGKLEAAELALLRAEAQQLYVRVLDSQFVAAPGGYTK